MLLAAVPKFYGGRGGTRPPIDELASPYQNLASLHRDLSAPLWDLAPPPPPPAKRKRPIHLDEKVTGKSEVSAAGSTKLW